MSTQAITDEAASRAVEQIRRVQCHLHDWHGQSWDAPCMLRPAQAHVELSHEPVQDVAHIQAHADLVL